MTPTLPTVLDEIDDYLDARADSEDGSYGIPEARREMETE